MTNIQTRQPATFANRTTGARLRERASGLSLAVALGLALPTAAAAQNLPVVTNAGSANITTPGNDMQVDINGASRIIEWNSFNVVGTNRTVSFVDLASAVGNFAVLNRVTGATASNITGNITSASNIAVWLVNPNGIFFGRTGTFNGGGLVLSTLDINNNDFLDTANGTSSPFRLQGASTADINLSDSGGGDLGSLRITSATGSLIMVGRSISVAKPVVYDTGNPADVITGAVSMVSAANVDFLVGPASPLALRVNVGAAAGTSGVSVASAISAGSIGMVALREGDVIANLLNVSAAGSLTAFASNGAIVLATKSPDTGSVAVSSATADDGINIAGQLQATGTGSAIRIAAGGAVTATANIAAQQSGSVRVSGASVDVNSAAVALSNVESTAGLVSLVSGGELRVDGVTSTGGAITLTAGQGVSGRASGGRASAVAATAGTNVTVTANGSNAFMGPVAAGAGGAASVTGASVDVRAPSIALTSATATTGSLTLDATAGNLNFTGAPAFSWVTDLRLGATGDVTFGTLNSPGNATIVAGGNVIGTALTTTNGNISVQGGNDVRGTVDRLSLTTGGANRNIGVFALGGTARLSTVTATGAATVSGNAVDVEAASVSLTSATSGSGQLRLNATGGNVLVDQATTSGGAIVITSFLAVRERTVDARTQLTAGGIGSVNVTATGGVARLGAVSAGTAANVTGQTVDINSGSVSLSSVTSTGGVAQIIANGGDVRVDTVSATGGIASVTAVGDVAGRLVGSRANITSTGLGNGVAVTATGGTALLGQVDATTGTATVTGRRVDVSSNAVRLTSASSTNGNLALTATGGDLTVGIANSNQGNATLTATNGTIRLDSASAVGGAATVTASNGVTGNTGARASVSASGGGNGVGVDAGAGSATLGTVSADPAGLAIVSGRFVDVSAANVDLTSATATNGALSLVSTVGDLRVGNAVAVNGNATLTSALGVAGRTPGTRAAVSSTGLLGGGSVAITATGGTAFLGQVTREPLGAASVTARAVDVLAPTVSLTSATATAGSMTLEATAGDLTVPLGATWTTTGTFRASQDVIAAGNLVSPHALTVAAGRDISGFVFQATTGAFALSAGRDVIASQATALGGGVMTITGGRDVRGPGIARLGVTQGGAFDSSITAGTGIARLAAVNVNANDALTTDQVTGAVVDISAAGVWLDRVTSTNGNLSLLATTLDGVLVNDISATDGDVSIISAGNVAGVFPFSRANVTATGAGRSINIAANGGIARLGNVSADAAGTAIASGQSVDVSANQVSLTNATTTNGFLRLTASTGEVRVDTATANGGDAIVTAALGVSGRTPGGRATVTATGLLRNVQVFATGGSAFLGQVASDPTGFADITARSIDVESAIVRLSSVNATGGNLRAAATGGTLNMVTGTATGSTTLTATGFASVGTALGGTSTAISGAGTNVNSATATTGDLLVDGTTGAGTVNTGTAGGNSTVRGTGASASSLTAGGNLIVAGGTGTALLNSGSANGTASVIAIGAVAANSLVSGGALTVTSGGALTSSTQLRSVTDSINVSGGSVFLASARAGTSLSTIASTGNAQLGTATAGSSAVVQAGGLAEVANLTAGTTATVRGASVSVGTASTGNGALTLTATGGDVLVNSATANNGATTVTASGGVRGRTAGSRANVTATGAGGNVAVTATGGQAFLANVGGTGTADVTGQSVDIRHTSIGLSSAVATGGNLLAEATAGNANIGTATATGTGTITATGNASAANFLTDGTATLTAGGAATSSNFIRSTTGNVAIQGASAGVETARAGAAISVVATAGAARLTSGLAGTSALVQSTASTDIGSLAAGTDLTARGTSVAANSLNASTGNLIAQATGGAATIGSVSAGGTGSVTATGAAALNTLESVGAVTLTGGGAVTATLVRSVAGSGTVSGTSVDVTTANAGTALSMTASSGDLNLGTGTSGTTSSLVASAAGRDISVTTALTSGGAATVNAARSARLTQVTAATGDVTVTAGSEVTGVGPADANLTATTGQVIVNAGTLARLGTIVSGAGLSVTSQSVALGDTAVTGNLSVNATAGNATLGTVTATGTGNVTATGAVGITSLTTGGTLTAGAGGALTATTLRSTGGGVVLTGTTVDVTTANAQGGALSAIASGGTARVATGTASTTALIQASGLADTTTLTAGTGATLRGATVTGGTVSTAAGPLAIDATAGNATVGSATSGGAATLNATGGNATATLIRTTGAGAGVTVTGQAVAVATANAAGALSMTARLGNLDLGTGTAGTTAELRTTPGIGDVSVATSLTSGGAATIGSSRSARLAQVTASTGDVTVTSATNGEVTGIGTGNAGLIATAGQVLVTGGTLARLGPTTSGGNTTVVADTASSTSATAGGVLSFTARAGDASLGTATAGGAATVAATGNVTVANSLQGGGLTQVTAGSGGSTTATLTAGAIRSTGGAVALNGGTITVTTAASATTLGVTATGGSLSLGGATSGGDVQLSAIGTATLGAAGLSATGRVVNLTASNADIGGNVTASRIVVTNRSTTANPFRLGTNATGTGGFELLQDEVNRLAAGEVVLDAGTATGATRQNIAIGGLALNANVGSSRLDILGLQRVDVTGTVTAAGSAETRTIRLGGTAAPLPTTVTAADRATIIRVAANADGTGGRILAGSANLELRGTKIGFGQDQGFLQSIGLTVGGTPLDSTTVQGQFVANPNSSLYNSSIGGAPFSPFDQNLVAARTLTVRVGDYALFQNTGVTGTTNGATLGGPAGSPISNALNVFGPNPPDAAAFAIYGQINGVPGTATAVLGPTIIGVTAVDRANTRVNGCLIGGSGGCLVNVIAQPVLQVFDNSRTDVFKTASDFEIPFDPVVGTNNEALFGDVGTFGLADIPLDPECTDPKGCPKEQK